MKKLITLLLVLTLLTTLTGCKEKEIVPLFNEESNQIIADYDAQNFGEEYNIDVAEYDPNKDRTTYYNFYDVFLARKDTMIKKITPKTFMDIATSQTELRQIFFVVGDKNDVKLYGMLENIQKTTEETGMVTFFVDLDDLYADEEVHNWFMERFNYNEIFLEEMGYTKAEIKDMQDNRKIPSPIVYSWWNQVFIDIQVMGPNIWSTDEYIEQIFVPVPEDAYEMYPLGCEQIKIDLQGRI